MSFVPLSQKYKANADLPSEEDEDIHTAFNKLRESDESSELETQKPAPATKNTCTAYTAQHLK